MFTKRRLAVFVLIFIGVAGLSLYVSQSGHTDDSKASQSSTARRATPAPAAKNQGQNNEDKASKDFDLKAYSTTDPASLWVVVNKKHPLEPKTYAPGDLQPAGGGQYLRAEAATALGSMFSAAKQAGLTLSAASGYRSYTTQVAVYDNEVRTNGQSVADSQSARPGYSEHQTGLAMDIAGGGCSIEDCFGTTAEGKWAAANAYKYGFILRYTPDKTAVTGYRAEAWHYRYVGLGLATYMHDTGLETLEEVFDVSGGASY